MPVRRQVDLVSTDMQGGYPESRRVVCMPRVALPALAEYLNLIIHYP